MEKKKCYLKPTQNFLLLKMESSTTSGIALQETRLKDSIEIKEVVAIGPDVKNIEPGDKVIFNFRNLPEIVSDPVLTKQETFIKTSGIKVPGPELLDVKE